MNTLSIQGVVLRIIVIISAAEFFVMLALGVLPLQLSTIEEALLDLFLLALISTPLIYLVVIKPFVIARDQAIGEVERLAHTDPLIEITSRLSSLTRKEDVVARLGGDEFVILLHHVDVNETNARETVLSIAEKLIYKINQPIDTNGMALSVGVSLGVRLLGFGEIDAETAIREADNAMYRSKEGGGEQAFFFSSVW